MNIVHKYSVPGGYLSIPVYSIRLGKSLFAARVSLIANISYTPYAASRAILIPALSLVHPGNYPERAVRLDYLIRTASKNDEVMGR